MKNTSENLSNSPLENIVQSVDFREHIPLGRTGLMVSRLGLASGYGLPAASIEKAYYEYNLNYFYLSFLKRSEAKKAMSNLLPRYREKMVVVLPFFPICGTRFLRRNVEAWLQRLDIDNIDILLLQAPKPSNKKIFDQAVKLKEEGKIKFLGMSSHDRPLLGSIAKGEYDIPVDLLQTRYNLVHRGAEKDIYPHLTGNNSPGIVAFTATCWGKPLKARKMPSGETPLTAADCYRFVLSNPNVNVCITGPSSASQFEENLAGLEGGPMTNEEMERVKRIGDHIYRK